MSDWHRDHELDQAARELWEKRGLIIVGAVLGGLLVWSLMR